MAELDITEMLIRMVVAIVAGGLVGIERDLRGHDAGVRTHILVSLGAAIATMVQVEAVEWGIDLVMIYPELSSSLSFDLTRITAQIISGIGFLGAGTIIIANRSVSGLTTAASIWAIAAIGIAAGMGYYFLVIIGSLLILIVLRVFKQIFRVKRRRRLEIIVYINREETLALLTVFFQSRNIHVSSIEYSVNMENPDYIICEDLYTLGLPHGVTLGEIIPELMKIPSILRISTIKEALD